MITLITGGVKSGKTTYALSMCESFHTKSYLATAEPFDELMEKKIAMHRQERDSSWTTIEEPVELHTAINETNDIILIDCMTMWLNNLMYKKLDIDKHVNLFIERLINCRKHVVIVSNEVGLGILPGNTESCEYADRLGLLNQKLASISGRVILMVASVPVVIKGEHYENH